MPTLKASQIRPNNNNVSRVPPKPLIPVVSLPPELPAYLTRSPVLISSVPSVFTGVEGTIRQFYGTGNLPVRRAIPF